MASFPASRGRGSGRGRIGQNYRAAFTGRSTIKSMRVSGGDDEEKYSAAKSNLMKAIERKADVDGLDSVYGFDAHESGERVGWLFNVCSTSVVDEELKVEKSAVDLYFLEMDGSTFKATYVYAPYFLIAISKDSLAQEVETYLLRRFDGLIDKIEISPKEDLEMTNHLSGQKRNYLKLIFKNVQDLMSVRKHITARLFAKSSSSGGVAPVAAAADSYAAALEDTSELGLGSVHGLDGIVTRRVGGGAAEKPTDYLDHIVDIREYDVPYIVRVMIDKGYRVGLWYQVRALPGPPAGQVVIEERKDLVERPEPRVMAFDIETTKLPLKFPDAKTDSIMMISYMLDGKGFLIVNREIVSEDIADFEYTPKAEFPGPFTCINEPNERALLQRWFAHVREVRPTIYVSYNGDRFDWPFIETRAQFHGMSLMREIGIWKDQEEYRGRFAVHLDCFHWVQRDSYLPQGSHGLKAVTKAKLKYEPLELDPEDMLPFAQEKPQVLASYSVSDAVATYYLYMTYVHLFIFSLCTIIPLPPADVLRKGSGTLCEQLLMVEAYRGNIICPNKQKENPLRFYQGHLLESETYIGGHVESLEPGVFRSDIPCKFKIVPSGAQQLIDDVDKILEFAIKVEGGAEMSSVTNYDEVRKEIVEKLESLRDHPNIEVNPLIYHLDVGAMYPNIILTNRLQPMAIVSQAQCAACDFNRPENKCQRPLHWVWRGEYFPLNRSEYESIRAQIEFERPEPMEDDGNGDKWRKPINSFSDLPEEEQAKRILARSKDYSRKVYKRVHDRKEELREAVTCQRENSFYVDTVRAFRDRRYEYKHLTKVWKNKASEAKNAVETVQCKNMILLYDSLQLAHKCILNSFYGYVMRKGARWHSMEMAGVVTKTGSEIIKDATRLVTMIGRPLELDTDGIWCILPCTFPENFVIKTNNPKKAKITVSFPCSMLNVGVHTKYSNPQYQTLVDAEKRTYTTQEECSIFFEIDGPYKAMTIPASTEEGRNLKKRYAVFNHDGSIAELKGFEIKRRGELKLIKIFQSQVFSAFLGGDTLEGVYASVAAVANHWLDVLFSEGADLEDEEVFNLISEARSMSNSLEEYGDQKGTAITTARRLAQFLGNAMVKDKGLSCKFIVSKAPAGEPVSARAVPVAIFSAEPSIMRKYLRMWLKDSSLNDFDIRSILDWDYYITRLGAAIQKIITIPAALQKVANPVPRVPYPDWLVRRVRELNSTHKQSSLGNYFKSVPASSSSSSSSSAAAAVPDIEDGVVLPGGVFASPRRGRAVVRRLAKQGGAIQSPSSLSSSSSSEAAAAADGDSADNELAPSALDMDDAADSSSSSFSASSSSSAASRPSMGALAKSKSSLSAAVAAVPAPAYVAIEDDIAQWSRFAKHKWRQLVADKKRKRDLEQQLASGGLMLDDDDDHRAGRGRSGQQQQLQQRKPDLRAGLSNYLLQSKAQTQALLLERPWHIVSIVEDDMQPGAFRVWAFLDAHILQSVVVHVPRIFYMNLRTPDDSKGRRVERLLPHGRPCLNLYEVVQSEAEWRATNKDMLTFLHEPHVEGVYETRVSPAFRFMCEVGCVARVNRLRYRKESREHQLKQQAAKSSSSSSSSAKSAAGSLFQSIASSLPLSMNHLDLYTGGDTPSYLSHAVFRRVYFYHSHAYNGDGRELFAIVFDSVPSNVAQPDGSSSSSAAPDRPAEAQALVLAVDPFESQLELPSLSRMLQGIVRDEEQRREQQSVHAFSHSISTRLHVPHTRFDPSAFASVPASLLSKQGAASSVGGVDVAGSRVQFVSVSNASQAVVLMRAALEEFRNTYRGPCVFFAQCPEENSQIYRIFPTIKTDCPVVNVPYHLVDDKYPLLGWFPYAAQHFLTRYATSGSWFFDQLRLSRYAQVPVGNLKRDSHAHVADVFFARHLKSNNHLLWASDSTRPDLGGLEEDENFYTDEHTNPEICFPGCVRSYCAELELHGLAVNSLLKMSVLEEMEGQDASDIITAAAAGGGAASGIDSMSQLGADGQIVPIAPSARLLADDKNACRSALKILCGCVLTWFDDLKRTNNVWADAMLSHLYRWLRSPNSILYDPSLHRMIHKLMKKVFMQLLAELKRLGARIIFASFTRLLIGTNKHNLAHALTYVTYASNTINSKDLLSVLTVVPTRFFEHLLFLDSANYGAVLPDIPDDGNQPLLHLHMQREQQQFGLAAVGTMEDEDVQNSQLALSQASVANASRILSHWNIAEYLPEMAKVSFLEIMGKFIWAPYEFLQRRQGAQQLINGSDADSSSSSSAAASVPLSQDVVHMKQRQQNLDQYMQSLITGDLAHRLFDLVQAICLHHVSDGLADSAISDFPMLPGSHLPLNNPALEFIKNVCHILSMDPAVQQQVRLVKTNLLKLIDVRAFSAEAEFHNPCRTFILPDVICSFCSDCRDLDLCRDNSLLVSPRQWLCVNCEQPYDRELIENTLISTVQRRLVSFQLQDLICLRCRKVKMDNMAQFCKCSGSFKNSQSNDDFARSFRVFCNIARFYEFRRLEESVNFILHQSGF